MAAVGTDHVAQITISKRRLEATLADAAVGSERPVILQITSSVPVNGKQAFTMEHQMTQPLSVLVENILRQHARTRFSQHEALRLRTEGYKCGMEDLPLDKSFFDLGFYTFAPSLITLIGFQLEVTVKHYGLKDSALVLPWSPHTTVTDVLKSIVRKYKPKDLRHMRLLVERQLKGQQTKGTSAENHQQVERVELPTHFSYKYPPSAALDGTITMKGIGLVSSNNDPCSIYFTRTSSGKPYVFNIPCTGSTTIQDVSDKVIELGESSPLDLEAALVGGTISEHKCDVRGVDGEIEKTKVMDEDLLQLLQFDDEDDEISPQGNRTVYFVGCEDVGTINLSFNPPAKEVEYQEPIFVSIDEEWRVPHLADAGVPPGATLYADMFNPLTGVWASELHHSIVHCQHFGGNPVPGDSYDAGHNLRMEKGRTLHYEGSSTAAADPVKGSDEVNAVVVKKVTMAKAADAAESSKNVDVLTVRTPRGQLLRVPCCPYTKLITVLQAVWCVTGDLPDWCMLQLDSGLIVSEWSTLVDAGLFPQATLHLVERPRLWLGESPTIKPPTQQHRLLDVPEPK